MAVSVVILTLNEEKNLPGALESLCGLCDDVVVFDSGSADRTRDIARQHQARVVVRLFDNYAAQRNAALTIDFKNSWVLMIDADERMTPELWKELTERAQNAPANLVMFRVRRKDYFLNTWLKRSSGYPTWFGRLGRIGKFSVVREINEEYVADGDVGYLQGHLIHYPFNRGVDHWIERHNSYSRMEASRVLSELKNRLDWRALVSSDPTIRRRILKQIAFRLPFRPTLVFFYLYVVRLGFLDGAPGYTYCRLRAAYELFIDIKVREIRSSLEA